MIKVKEGEVSASYKSVVNDVTVTVYNKDRKFGPGQPLDFVFELF